MKPDDLSRQELLDIELSLENESHLAHESGKPELSRRLMDLRDKIHAARMEA